MLVIGILLLTVGLFTLILLSGHLIGCIAIMIAGIVISVLEILGLKKKTVFFLKLIQVLLIVGGICAYGYFGYSDDCVVFAYNRQVYRCSNNTESIEKIDALKEMYGFESEESYLKKALIALENNDIDQAEYYLNETDENSEAYYLYKGILYTKQRNLKIFDQQKYLDLEADLYHKAVFDCPMWASGDISYASTLYELNAKPERVQYLTAGALSKNDKDQYAWFYAGVLYYDMSDYDNALQAFKNCLEYADDQIIIEKTKYFITEIDKEVRK